MEWIITSHAGEKVWKRMPAPPSRPNRVGPGAVRKANARRAQLDRDLSIARRELIERAARGEFAPRSATGESVERLGVAKASALVEPTHAVICDPPLRRGSKQLSLDEPVESEGYATSVVCGPVIINGRAVARDQDDGGQHGGHAVRKLN